MRKQEVSGTLQITSCGTLKDEVAAWVDVHRESNDKRLDDVFVLQRTLGNPIAASRLPFPCTITLRESPDFLLTSNGLTIGIEVTRFLAEQRARAAKIANKHKVGHSPTPFDFDSPRRTNSEITEMVGDVPVGLSGWRSISDTLTLYTTEFERIVLAKTQKAILNSDLSANQWWLVIEDQHFLSPFDLHNFKEMCGAFLVRHWSSPRSFDRIFFLSITDAAHSIEHERPPNQASEVTARKLAEPQG
jgi:hypothetical protein